MRLIGKVALGGGLASVTTAGVLLAAGVFATSATLVVADPSAPQAVAKPKGLTAFNSCPDLLAWYVKQNLHAVGPYGWNDPTFINHGGVVEDSGMNLSRAYKAVPEATTPVSGTLDTRSASGTGSNTQEAAVDEPDVAKTNGTLVARIVDDERLVLVDVSGAEPRVTRRLHLPKKGYDSQLLLLGDHVLITQQVYDFAGNDEGVIEDKAGYYGHGDVATRVLDVDISDPTAPTLVSTDTYTGVLLAARQYDGDVIRLVTSTSRPQLHWIYPGHGVTPAQARVKNRGLLRRTTITDWLPSVSRDGTRTPLLDCADVSHPDTAGSGAATVAVTTLPAAHLDQRSALGITADAQIAYSSADRLYLASTVGPEDPRLASGAGRHTTLYAFDLTGARTTYAGSGDVDGILRDRWSLDEHDGRLRVAWTTTSLRGKTRNGLTVLTERDGALVPTGRVGDLGVGEDLQSVRWFDDVAVLVTFRQVDPLYTIDLSDPDHPVKLGVLKVPGYSGYLHPIGDHLLLGLGMSGDNRGRTGTQAAVFDISDLRHPVRLSQVTYRGNTGLPALDDPRAFTWVPDTSSALTPVADWTRDTAKLVALHVSPSGQLTSRTVADLNHDWQARTFALPEGRVAILDHHRVRVVAG